MMARKRDKERDRVRKIGFEYQSLSEMLGLHPRKQNKVLTLKAALQFIVENYEGMSTLLPEICSSPSHGEIEEETNSVEVASFPTHSPLVAATAVDCSPQDSSDNSSKDDNNLLICFEEVNYQDDSDEEVGPEEPALSGSSMSGSSHAQSSGTMVVSDFSSPQACFCVPPMPSNAVLFSPNTPWLTSASPQIAAFNANFSPPMQALQAQTTPKLHHLSPPIPSPVITGVYSPCIALPGSPHYFPMFDGHGGQREFHFLTGECACNMQQ